MSDDENLHQTMKISISDIKKLQLQTEGSGIEINISINPETLTRVDNLIEKMSQNSPTNFKTLTSEIFLEGLRLLEIKHQK